MTRRTTAELLGAFSLVLGGCGSTVRVGAYRRASAGFALLAVALGILVAAEAHGEGQSLPKVFGVLDGDGDGAIDEPEFENNKVRAMMLFDRNEDVSLERDEVKLSDAAFAEADSDGDGIISGVEFVEAPFGQFTTIDADHDGQVTPQELADFVEPLRHAGTSSSAM